MTDALETLEDQQEGKSLSYCINDFQINNLPESNPISTIIHEFQKKRMLYLSQVKKGLTPNFPKPKLEDFMKQFQSTVKSVNRTYKKTKQQFENEIKQF